MKQLILIIYFFALIKQSNAQHWVSMGKDTLYIPSNLNSKVTALDKIDNKLYAGGGFIRSRDTILWGLGIWDSTQWLPMGQFSNWALHSVNRFLKFQDKVLMGGLYSNLSGNNNLDNLASWNDTIWQPVGNIGAPNSGVYGMKVYQNKLFVGGGFGYIGNLYIPSMAAWDGAQWSNIGETYILNCFEIFNGELIAGSNNGIGHYNGGGQWQDLGNGVSGYVKAMVTDTINNFLYAGGWFTQAGNVSVGGIAMWDGYSWHDVGGGFDDEVLGLGIYMHELYAGGWFLTAGGQPIKYAARWDGTQWQQLGSGVDKQVYAFAEYKNELYVGGAFKNVGGLASSAIAKWVMPQNFDCNWLQPKIYSDTDTAYLIQGQAQIQFYNNNSYADHWIWSFGDTIQNPLYTFTNIGSFVITLTVIEEGCVKTATKNIVILLPNEIQSDLNYLNDKIKIYPNPANDKLNIESKDDASIDMIDSYGQIINTMTLKNEIKIFDISDLSFGIYNMRIKVKEKIFMKKFMKQ